MDLQERSKEGAIVRMVDSDPSREHDYRLGFEDGFTQYHGLFREVFRTELVHAKQNLQAATVAKNEPEIRGWQARVASLIQLGEALHEQLEPKPQEGEGHQLSLLEPRTLPEVEGVPL